MENKTFKDKLKKDVSILKNTNYSLSFKPFLLLQGTAVFVLSICVLFTVSLLVLPKPQISQSQIMQTAIVKQVSPAIAGENVKWSVVVKKSDIASNKNFIQLPKSAKNIKIKSITKKEAQNILSKDIFQSNSQLTTKERKKLAEASSPSSFFIARLLSKFSKLFLASTEDAVDQVIETITQEVITTDDAKFVDLSNHAEPVPAEASAFDEFSAGQVGEVKENTEPTEEVLPKETLTEAEIPAEEETPAETTIEESAQEETPTSDIKTTETSEIIPSSETEIIQLPEEPLIETTSPSNQEIAATSDVAATAEEEEYVEIDYETPAPQITEQETEKGKIVKVSSQEDDCLSLKLAQDQQGILLKVTGYLFASIEDAASQAVETITKLIDPTADTPSEPVESAESAEPFESMSEPIIDGITELPADEQSTEQQIQNEQGLNETALTEIPTVESADEESYNAELLESLPEDENLNLDAEQNTEQTPQEDTAYQECLKNQVALTDVLAYTTIPEIYKVGQESKIKIKWKNEGNQEMEFHAFDLNENGKLDYVEWTVPHLSEQIFEIIFISKAFELDENQEIVADIYDLTVAQDNQWATVPNGHYVRATFEQILDSAKDITVYARPATSDVAVTIEVYPVYTDDNGNQTEGSLIVTFSAINKEETYKVLLTNLPTPTDVFDLKIIGNIDIDYIVDPTYVWGGTGSTTSTTAWDLATNWSSGTVPTGTDTASFTGLGNATISSGTPNANVTVSVDSSTNYSMSVVFSGTTAVTKAGTGTLTLSGANTFTGGLTIKAGTVSGATSTSAFGGSGTGAVTIGDTSGSADATLKTGTYGITFANPITVAAGSSGTLSIGAGQEGHTFSGAITLNNNLTIASSNSTFSGGITGTGNLIIARLASGSVLLSTTSVNHTGTITNSCSNASASSFTISAVIGSNVTGVIQNSSTLQMVLSGNNSSYAGGVTIQAGTVQLQTSANAAGTGTITIGDTSGTADATLKSASLTYANPITVASGSSGVATLSGYWSTLSGAITLNKDLTLNNYSTGPSTISGGITGAGNLTINNTNAQTITLQTASINNTGTITNSGTGAGTTTISAVIGTNVTGVVQNSATSQLTLSGANTFTSGLTIKAGTVLGQTSTKAFGDVTGGGANGTITLGDGTVNASVTLSGGTTQTYANPITVASISSGTATIQRGANSPTFSGAIALNDDVVFAGAAGTLTISGAISGTGNITATTTTTGAVTISNASINPNGTITNNGTSSGATTISGVIGSNVTGVIQNSSTSALTLSGNNSTMGDIDIQAGTLTLAASTNLNVSDDWSNAGTFTASASSTVTFTAGNHAVTGANTFVNWTWNANNTVTLPASTTQTISGTITCAGTAGNLITLNSGTPATKATLSKSSGTVSCDYMSITDSSATGGATWSASNSTGSNYDGWTGLNVAPNAPTLVSPANASYTTDTTPTLSANYSDNDAGDVGTTNYRISSSSLADCTNNVNVVASGTSSETPDNNEDTTWTNGSSVGNDATYYWCAQNNDGVDTSSWTQMGNFILDTAVVVPTVTAVGGDTASAWSTSDTSPLITLTLNENGDCRASELDDSYDLASDDVDCTGDGTQSISCQLGTLAESASKVIYVACQDTAGNKDTNATNEEIATEIDATTPTISGYSPASGSTIADSTPTITLTTDESGDCYASADGDETYDQMSDDTNCTGDGTTSHSCTMADLGADGSKTIYVSCKDDTDASTNKDTALTNDSVSYTLDTTVPSPSSFSPASASTITDSTPTITFSLDENGDCFASTTDETYDAMSDNTNCTGDGTQSTSCTLSDLGADGAKNVYVACQDTAGNKDDATTNENLTYTLDTVPPAPSSFSPASASTITDTTPTITFILNENGDCRLSLLDDSYDLASDDVDCTGDGTTSISCTSSDLGSDGSKNVYAACQDTAGNKDTNATNEDLTYTLDTTSPVPTVTAVGGDTASAWSTSDTSPLITLTLNENGDCRASELDDSYDLASDDVDCTGDGTQSISCQLGTLAESASKVIYVACQDTAGNKDTNATNEEIATEIDATTPTISGYSPASGSTIADSTPTITLTTDESGDCYASADGDETYDQMSDDTNCTGDGTTSHSCTMADLGADGAKTIYFSCEDDTTASPNKHTADNNGSITLTLDSAAPAASGFDPAEGFRTLPSSITFTLNEVGYCRSSSSDLAYSSMTSANDCSGGGTTSIACNVSNSEPYSLTAYISCQDILGNENTAANNNQLYYHLPGGGGGGSWYEPAVEIIEKTVEEVKKIPEKVVEQVSQQVSEIAKTLLPEPEEQKITYPPIEESVAEEAPLVFQTPQSIIPPLSIGDFVLAPLPKDIKSLIAKFPALKNTFEKLGINKITDLQEIRTGSFNLPALNEILPELSHGILLSKISAIEKEKIPTNIVFASMAEEKIGLNIKISITNEDKPIQTIRTIENQIIALSVKPESAPESVKGYVIFKGKNSPVAFAAGLSVLLTQPQKTDLVLNVFDYTDIDKDEIYTASIVAPKVAADYEIKTVINYKNPVIYSEELSTIMVVDPEGYIYKKINDSEESRIKGAKVSIYWLNPETKQYEIWPAKNFLQENPQITNATGKYSFMVPEGSYYLKVEHMLYADWQSESFEVQQGTGVHINIELKPKNWLLAVFSPGALLIAVALLLLTGAILASAVLISSSIQRKKVKIINSK